LPAACRYRRPVGDTEVEEAPRQAREAAAENSGEAPVIDVTKHGIFKVLGKGELPAQPVLVRCKFISKLAEAKIKEVGGAVELVA
jgi:large subunit ribosomal protein L27Ae